MASKSTKYAVLGLIGIAIGSGALYTISKSQGFPRGTLENSQTTENGNTLSLVSGRGTLESSNTEQPTLSLVPGRGLDKEDGNVDGVWGGRGAIDTPINTGIGGAWWENEERQTITRDKDGFLVETVNHRVVRPLG